MVVCSCILIKIGDKYLLKWKFSIDISSKACIAGLHLGIKSLKIIKLDFQSVTGQKKKFSIKDFFSKCDQIHRKLRIWPYLLKKFLIENLIFLCSVWAA